MAHNHLARFFARYAPQFSYNPQNSSSAEFHRLCKILEWKKDGAPRKVAREEFNTALTLQFNADFGTKVNNLDSWYSLATHMGIMPVPSTLKACRQQVKTSHVNLIDLVSAFAQGGKAKRFDSEEALSVYTKATRKFFPRENVHSGDLLKFLLRQIRNPGQDRNKGSKQDGRGKGRGH